MGDAGDGSRFPVAALNAARRLNAGTQIGRYKVHKKLGEGGFGAVYLASLSDGSELVAVKHAVNTDTASQASFEREAQAWVKLGGHPFIVTAQEVIRQSGEIYVVMDYIAPDTNGLTTVADHIEHRGRDISDAEIGNWCIQFCRGMELAHSRGLRAHRDIKPLNLLIDSWRLRISDFGLAAAAPGRLAVPSNYLAGSGHSTVFRMGGRGFCGTPGYIAPELINGAEAGPSSDIFSFGVTLWQMAAGSPELPYEVAYRGDMAQFLQSLLAEQVNGRARRVESVYWPLIRRCLSADSAQRPQTFAELADDTKVAMKSQGIRVIDYMVKDDESSVATLIRRAANLRQLDLLEEAAACLAQVLDAAPRNAVGMNNLGNIYSDQGRHAKAISAYRAAAAADPTLADPWLNLALSYRNSGQSQLGLDAAERAIELEGGSALAYRAKAQCLASMGEFEAALEAYNSALQRAGGNGRLWFEAGEMLSRLNRSEEALRCYEKAAFVAPRIIRAWTYQAMELIRLQRESDATACVKALIEAFPNDGAVLNEVGVAYTKIGDYRTAIAYFRRALALGGGEVAVLLANIGAAYYDLEQPADAVAPLLEAIKGDPSYPLAHKLLGKAYFALGQYAEAAASLRRFFVFDRTDSGAFFLCGTAFLHLGDYVAANDEFNESLGLNQASPKVWYNKAAALCGMGNFKAASSALQQATSYSPGYENAWWLRMQVEKKLGDMAASASSCRKYLALPDAPAERRQEASNWLQELEGKRR